MDFLKKSVAFSLGAAMFSAEKLKQLADEMVARGEMSSDEARKFVDDVSNRAEEEKKSIQDWVQDQVSKMLQQAGAAESSRVDQLELRIAALEKRVAEMAVEEESFVGAKGGTSSTCEECAHPGEMADLSGAEDCD